MAASKTARTKEGVETTFIEYSRNRDLVDPDFNGYKLSLDSLPVNTCNVEGPQHRGTSTDMYSFLHAKLFGEQNHIVSDPFNDDMAFFIGCKGNVFSVCEAESPCEVWSLPAGGQSTELYNCGLTFPSPSLAVLSDGRGSLYILETGDRTSGVVWKAVFQDQVCGKSRPFIVRYSVVQDEGKELEVVLQYVEEKDKLEENSRKLPSSLSGESTFLNCIEWISFSKGTQGWMMERVRRILSPGGINYIGLTGSTLALAAEKKTFMSFDSQNPVEEDLMVDQGNTNAGDAEEKPSFYWRQTNEDLELWLYVATDTNRKAVKVDISGLDLSVKVGELPVLAGNLFAGVEQGSWTWTLEQGKLTLLMTKATEGGWESIWKSGPKGQEVLDNTEDNLLPHLTTDNPLVGGELSGQIPFNTQELESVDDCLEENSVLVWQSEPSSQHVASLVGHQHLFTLQQKAPGPPTLCVRHDVDGFVWTILDCEMKHTAVFPALGYVQASKQERKFIAAPYSSAYSAICDASRHVYIYRQPKPLPAGSELKNRKSGKRVEGVAVQQVVTLDNNDEIFGMTATPNILFVITARHLYRIKVN